MDKIISQHDFLSGEQDTIRHIKQQVAVQYTDFLTEQLAHREPFRVYNTEDLREMLIGVITGRGIIERNTHVQCQAADGYFEIINNAIKDFAEIKDVAILQLSAPISRTDRRFSQDQFSRDYQLKKFYKSYRSNFHGYKVEPMDGVVKKYEDILGFVRNFFMCLGIQAKYSVIVYNGHGTPSGNISLEDETHQRSNTQLLEDIYRIRDECWSKTSQGVRLPLHTKVIFAQCYGHLYEQPKEQLAVIQVVALSSETDPETKSIIEWNHPVGTPGNVIRESTHVELYAYGTKPGRRSEFDILQDLPEEADAPCNNKDYSTQLDKHEPSPQDSQHHFIQSHSKHYSRHSKKSKHCSLPPMSFSDLDFGQRDREHVCMNKPEALCSHEETPATVNDSKQGDTQLVHLDSAAPGSQEGAYASVSERGICMEYDGKTVDDRGINSSVTVPVNDDLPGSTVHGEPQHDHSAVTKTTEEAHQNEDGPTQLPTKIHSSCGCTRAINSTYSRTSVCDLLHPLPDDQPRDTIELTLDIASCRNSMCPDYLSQTSLNNVPQNTTEKPIQVTEVLEDVVPGYNYQRTSHLSKEEFQCLSYGEFLRRMHEQRQAQMSTDCPESSSQQLVERRCNPGRRNVEKWYCIYHSNVSEDIHSPTIHSRTYNSGPDTADHNGPDTADHNGPDTAELNGPDTADHNGPDTADHNGPDAADHNGPDAADHNGPDTADHNGAYSADHNSPVSIRDHNGPKSEHLSPIIPSGHDDPDSTGDHNVSDCKVCCVSCHCVIS